MGKKKTDLTQGNITLQLLQFGLPIVVSMILQNLYNVADSLVVGRFIGDHALAAVGSSDSPKFLSSFYSQTHNFCLIFIQY